MKNIYTFLLVIIVVGSISAQHICGTSHAAQRQAVANIMEYRKNPILEARSNEMFYLPFTIHRIGRDNGTGRISSVKLIEQFQALQKDYRSSNIFPYLKQFNDLNDTKLFTQISSNASSVNAKKDNSSVNLFVSQNADVGGSQGTVLGYYNPQYDYLVVKNNEIKPTGSTLPHELGHFLSLPHTFFGWESEAYNEEKHGNPVTLKYAPNTNIPVELVDRSNCGSAADALCDTPPDYNFGLGASSCSYAKKVMDGNGDTIRTMANNFMGYFLRCDSYQFTQDQIATMRSNYSSGARNYLRSDYIPDTSTIGTYEILSDIESLGKHYDQVFIDWEDAENASHYAITIQSVFGDFQDFILDKSELTLTNLGKDDTHKVRLIAYHEGIGYSPVKEFQFRTSKTSVSTLDTDIVTDVYVYPNPAIGKDNLYLYMATTKASSGSHSLYDINGRLLASGRMDIQSGVNTFAINIKDIPAGMYFVEIATDFGTVQRKVSIR